MLLAKGTKLKFAQYLGSLAEKIYKKKKRKAIIYALFLYPMRKTKPKEFSYFLTLLIDALSTGIRTHKKVILVH